jgi:hypothetical protein
MSKKARTTRPRRKAVYHVGNWPEYDRALVKRGSLTVWVSEEVLEMWRYTGPSQRGAQFEYSDQAIEAMLMVREVFHLTNRTTEGFMRSLFQLMQVDLSVPDHTTLSRRGKTLKVSMPKRAQGELHLVIDSSGLKLYGEGEWKVRQHGWSKRRSWRKFHLAVDADTSEIQAAMLTEAGVHDAEVVQPMLEQVGNPIASLAGDGSYDKRRVYDTLQVYAPGCAIAIPPGRNARIWQHGNTKAPPLPRDENLRFIRKHGRNAWKKHSRYHRRSLAETAVFRMKMLFDDHLNGRLMATQVTQTMIRCSALNRMTHLGMPVSFLVS